MHTTIDRPPACTNAFPWTADQGDGTYRNPVLWADYSDPDAIRDGEDFWLTASSFNCTPGLPILHSHDLVNWRLVNYALRNLPHPRYGQVQHGCGVWAPAIRKHDGRFWIFFPMPDEGIFVTTADDPAGAWSEPWCLVECKGLIDPCPLWDDDGNAWLVHAFARSRCGIKHRLRVCPMAADGSRLLDEGRIVFDDPQRHPTLEGPKFFKRHGYYYISAPAGGVKEGWQVVLRSRHVYGPYEHRVVLAQGATMINGPHQGALVELANGAWWFLHFQDAGVYGRIVHLQPVQWIDDWPAIGIDEDGDGVGEPVLQHAKPLALAGERLCTPASSDEFDQPRLGLQWQWHANHEEDWCSLSARPGWLRLRAVEGPADLAQLPNLLLQKFPAPMFHLQTQIELTRASTPVQAGLIVMGQTHAALMLESRGRDRVLQFVENNRVLSSHMMPVGPVRLAVDVYEGGRCAFSYAQGDSRFVRVDPLFQATPGHWIGAKVGLFCRQTQPSVCDGHADVGYFRFSALR